MIIRIPVMENDCSHCHSIRNWDTWTFGAAIHYGGKQVRVYSGNGIKDLVNHWIPFAERGIPVAACKPYLQRARLRIHDRDSTGGIKMLLQRQSVDSSRVACTIDRGLAFELTHYLLSASFDGTPLTIPSKLPSNVASSPEIENKKYTITFIQVYSHSTIKS